jgi:hypothetical protein
MRFAEIDSTKQSMAKSKDSSPTLPASLTRKSCARPVHSRLRPYLQGVIASIGSLFTEATVVAMWHTTTGLTDAELAALGFRRIAGSGLIYRHSALRFDFSDENPTGMDVPIDFDAEVSDAEWVLAEWKKVDSGRRGSWGRNDGEKHAVQTPRNRESQPRNHIIQIKFKLWTIDRKFLLTDNQLAVIFACEPVFPLLCVSIIWRTPMEEMNL